MYLLDLRTGRVYTKALGDDWPELVGSWNGKEIQLLERSTAGKPGLGDRLWVWGLLRVWCCMQGDSAAAEVHCKSSSVDWQ